MRRRCFIAALTLALIATIAIGLVAPTGVSASVEKRSLDELTLQADTIIVGTVTNITSQWDDEHRHIYSLVTIAVEDAIKGKTGSTEVTIEVPGGEADGIREVVSIAPSFELGETVLVFLKQAKGNSFNVCGYSQGKFTVKDNRLVERDQSLTNFMVDISQVMESHGITPKLSVKPFSMVLESPVESKAVEPAKTEDFLTGWQNIMTDDFEGAFPDDWNVFANSGPDAYWGKDDYHSHGGSYSAFCAKNGSAGVSPPTHYPNNMNAWMVYGPFSLVDTTDAKVDFWLWLESQSGYDYLACMASTNGANFYGTGWDGDSGGWQSSSFDLTDVYELGNLCDEPQVWIAFVFASNSSITYDGAFIDDVVLQKYVAASATPQITSISPPSASVRTGTNVTISGSNFGATQGDSYVWFFARQIGEVNYFVKVPILSWSDTSIVVRVEPAPGYEEGWISSGPVYVVTPDGMSNAYEFGVTFSYGGCKWPGTNPTVEYLVNPNTLDTTGELTALQAALQTWNNVSDASFNFVYGGATGATDTGFNEQNEIMWLSSSQDYVAVNWGWYENETLLESDIAFNDADYDWSASTTCPSTKMDVENVAAHELGHTLVLLDLYGDADSAKTMYGFVANGQTKNRTLHADDIAGIGWIYPGATTPPTVSTSTATNIASTSATLNGNLGSKGTASTVYASFEYGPTTAYDNETTPQAMTTTGPFSFNLTGLSPDTLYHCRAKAVGDGTSYGSDRSFTTLPTEVPPTTAANRTLPGSVSPGADFNVRIVASGCGLMGDVAETLPAGFSYVGTTSDDVFVTPQAGNVVRFSFLGDGVDFEYTVTASTIEGPHTFSGVVKDDELNEYTIGGDTTITVGVFDPWDYDLDEDGVISKMEALTAVVDYFGGLITKQQALAVIVLYFAS